MSTLSVDRVTSALLGVVAGGPVMYYSQKAVREVQVKGGKGRKPALPPGQQARTVYLLSGLSRS